MTGVDFTPLWYYQRRQIRSDRRRRMVYLGAIAVLMMVWWSVNRGMIHSAQAALQDAHHGEQQVESMRSNLTLLREQRGKLQTQLQRFQDMALHISPTIVFAEISHLLPDEVRLEHFNLSYIDAQQGRQPTPDAHAEHIRHCGFKISMLAQARRNEDLLRFCLDLQKSALFEFTDFYGITTVEVEDGTIEQREIDLYVLRAEHIE